MPPFGCAPQRSATQAPLAAVLPELLLASLLVGGELLGVAARGPAAPAWGGAALPFLPPGGLAGAVLLAFGLTVVGRNVALLVQRGEVEL